MLVTAVSFLLLARVPDHGSYAVDILPAFIVLPLGAGLAFLSVTNAAVAGVESQDAGLASALLNTSQQVGGALGLALLSTIATSYTNSVLATDPAMGIAHALVGGFHRAFVVGLCFAVAGAILALFTISREIGRVDQPVVAAAEPEIASDGKLETGAAGLADELGVAGRITAAVESWEGASSHAHRFGDIELRAGGSELGYLHGDTVADLLLPKSVRDEAIATGVAHAHHVLPESNWVSVHIHHPEQIHDVLALLRSAYERAVRRPIQSPATE
jgi:hypothetical protein